jgi:N-ethylmaleimide reductase
MTTQQKARKLFTPVQVGAISLKHRIVLPPMSRLRANWPNATPSDLMLDYYTQRASDGGLVIAEATAVGPEARAYHTGPGLYSEDQVSSWKRITDAVHAKGSFMFIQFTHAGRSTSTAITQVAPVSASVNPAFWANESIVVSTPDGFTLPSPHRELETKEVAEIVQKYRIAAENAKQAGFDGIEILAGQGHLVEQFLHDGTNKRSDQYGGSFENRERFLIEILDAVIEVWSANRVAVRITPSSVFNGMGDSEPHALYRHLAKKLNTLGLAYLHIVEPRISGADTVDEDQDAVASKDLREVFTGPIIAAGGFTPESAEAIVNGGGATLISFGRPFTSNPDLPYRVLHDLPLTPYDRSTFYAFDAKGYTDWPTYEGAATTEDVLQDA